MTEGDSQSSNLLISNVPQSLQNQCPSSENASKRNSMHQHYTPYNVLFRNSCNQLNSNAPYVNRPADPIHRNMNGSANPVPISALNDASQFVCNDYNCHLSSINESQGNVLSSSSNGELLSNHPSHLQNSEFTSHINFSARNSQNCNEYVSKQSISADNLEAPPGIGNGPLPNRSMHPHGVPVRAFGPTGVPQMIRGPSYIHALQASRNNAINGYRPGGIQGVPRFQMNSIPGSQMNVVSGPQLKMLPPHMNGGILPSQMNGGILPNQMNGGILPSQMNGGIHPSQMNGGIIPPKMNGSSPNMAPGMRNPQQVASSAANNLEVITIGESSLV